MWQGAGLGNSIAYLSYDSLTKYGTSEGINCYEVVMPNPVSGFAYRLVKEGFGYSENEMVVVDNSARYGWEGLVKVIASLGLRSMQLNSVRLPFWENYARGFEDILAFIMVWQALFALLPAAIVFIALIYAYRHRPFTWKEVAVRGWEMVTSLLAKLWGKLPKKKKKVVHEE
jgi:hypothetical protein